jgi:galactokinase
MDVMGGIADYSGSMVLQMPIRERTKVRLQLRQDYLFRLTSTSGSETFPEFTIDYRSLLGPDGQPDYGLARQQIVAQPGGEWASYVLGCFLVLHREKNTPVTGANIHVTSEVPAGKGVSSSAALEVATLRALVQAYGLKLEGTELPVLAQQAENLVVGAPCGLMDQLASHLGQPNRLLPILCQPDQTGQPLPLPEGVRFVGLDSGVRHSVGGASSGNGASYQDVRAAAFMGFSLIARHCGTSVRDLEQARSTGDWSALPYQGYLANITPSAFDTYFREVLPEKLTGADFKMQRGISIDRVTTVQDQTDYAVRRCAQHPVYENFRVRTFALLLRYLQAAGADQQAGLTQLGELMYQSHHSYSLCGLGSLATDELVELARPHAGSGIYGAKITGGGSGGTVCLLCEGKPGLETARRLYGQYTQRHRLNLTMFV